MGACNAPLREWYVRICALPRMLSLGRSMQHGQGWVQFPLRLRRRESGFSAVGKTGLGNTCFNCRSYSR